ncbi:hypothetical protein CFIMG_005894RA [Ceratocystis fimbriata CBS 114723]|uniref:Uncharacterized protein n=1 Tax=Ceratocystis fimbriata CBS 114723 TaxID=1035309 RepID=A0A2C5WWH6_9PEZI|nr:hypothetical protein CFIMG_005894RA [Ceratocystis fimbriata CBS 114723]
MRATTLQASVTLLGLFFSLSFPTQATAALTNANLAPNDVPLICIDICGPMVELSSACQIPVDSSPEELRLLRRELDAREPVPDRHRKQRKTTAFRTARTTPPAASLTHQFRFSNTSQLAGGQVPATGLTTGQRTGTAHASSGMGIWRKTSSTTDSVPLSTGLGADFSLLPPSTTPRPFSTGISGTGSFRTGIPLLTTGGTRNSSFLAPPTTAFLSPLPSPLPPSLTSALPAGETGLPTIVDSGDPLAVGNAAGTENIHSGLQSSSDPSSPKSTGAVKESQLSGLDIKRVQAAEQDCVCSNDSFDVARVAALCSSCIAQAGFPMGPAAYIVWTCNFTEEVWTSNQDAMADNIVVKAKTPRVTGVNGSPRSSASHVTVVVMITHKIF